MTALLEDKALRLIDMMETKGRIAFVRTQNGVRKYGQPIGTLIVADTNTPLANIRLADDDDKDAEWTTVVGSNGKRYEVGWDDDNECYVATGEGDWDNVVVDYAETEQEAFQLLDRAIGNKHRKGQTLFGDLHYADDRAELERDKKAAQKRADALRREYADPKKKDKYNKYVAAHLKNFDEEMKQGNVVEAEDHLDKADDAVLGAQMQASLQQAQAQRLEQQRKFREQQKRKAEKEKAKRAKQKPQIIVKKPPMFADRDGDDVMVGDEVRLGTGKTLYQVVDFHTIPKTGGAKEVELQSVDSGRRRTVSSVDGEIRLMFRDPENQKVYEQWQAAERIRKYGDPQQKRQLRGHQEREKEKRRMKKRADALKPWTQTGPDYSRSVVDNLGRYRHALSQEEKTTDSAAKNDALDSAEYWLRLAEQAGEAAKQQQGNRPSVPPHVQRNMEINRQREQERFDHAVETAKQALETQKQTVKPKARTGMTLVQKPDGLVSVYRDDAWRKPEESVLPWHPPTGKPVGHVDLAGNVTKFESDAEREKHLAGLRGSVGTQPQPGGPSKSRDLKKVRATLGDRQHSAQNPNHDVWQSESGHLILVGDAKQGYVVMRHNEDPKDFSPDMYVGDKRYTYIGDAKNVEDFRRRWVGSSHDHAYAGEQQQGTTFADPKEERRRVQEIADRESEKLGEALSGGSKIGVGDEVGIGNGTITWRVLKVYPNGMVLLEGLSALGGQKRTVEASRLNIRKKRQ
jgi:hypothetical protein